MPQELRVVKCVQCEMFQLDIVKKVNKWQCKICNTKQSLRKEFFRGSGAECRDRVQTLNMQKAEHASQESDAILSLLSESNELVLDEIKELEEKNQSVQNTRKRNNTKNKWNSFLDHSDKEDKEYSSVSKDANSARSKWSQFL